MLAVAYASEQLTSSSVTRLEHEYALREILNPEWAAVPVSLAHEEGRSTLQLTDPGGQALGDMVGRPWDPERFLRAAIGMSLALGQVHANGLIHKNIKPEHVLVDLASGQAWLTGFGIASRLARERQAPDPPETIAGTLAYMAPEQTGRMNRSVDTRSDLYSLGVTFYQMLTGTLPFTATDPMELVHCHIARPPVPPCELAGGPPPALSDIVVKLLAKTAEDRYQTAAGVAGDLRHCLTQLEDKGRIDAFALGTQDRPDRLLIPEKLYGRAREVDTLLATFDRVVQGGPPELVLVCGYAGIGKSSVVNELQKALVPPRGIFASGKFDQYKRDIPYSTLAQAFQGLVRGLLMLSDADLAPWREDLGEALEPNGRLATDLVPELALIIGEQPPVPELPPQDARRRFHLVMRRFIGVFARPEHPLAIFFDDLQWLDAATLDLIGDVLTSPDLRHLLLIGAYRDHEVPPSHPLVRVLGNVREAGAAVHSLALAPLARDDVAELVADALHCGLDAAQPLAQLVHEKTGGNPFFVIQFLTMLADEQLLAFDHHSPQWTWDLARIHATKYTDNVVDLMIDRLRRLPEDTRAALQLLACLGDRADTEVLRMVDDDATRGLDERLRPAIHNGLVLPLDGSYRFSHDRIQEAAYALIDASRRAAAHLRIGRLLAARTGSEKRDETIFDIVNQLNRGSALIQSADEKVELARLNLAAGRRAKASTAYVSALHYLVAGAQMLPDGWQQQPTLMFPLELERAECEFLSGETAAADQRLMSLASRAQRLTDKALVACLRIDLYTTLNRSDLALDVCLGYLRHLDIDWSPHPTASEARHEYERTWALLGSREIEELIALPPMRDPDVLATMDVLVKALSPAMFTDPNLSALLLWRMVNLSVAHGNTDASTFAYTSIPVVSGPRFGNFEAGFRFGRLGHDLIHQRGMKRFEVRATSSFNMFVNRWTRHLRLITGVLRESFDAMSRSGDLTYASFSLHNLIGNLIAVGDPLSDVEREADQALEFLHRIQFGIVIDNIAAQRALVRTLRGETHRFGFFDDGDFDEQQFERRLSEPGFELPLCWYLVRKVQARFFAGEHEAAIAAFLWAQPLLWTTGAFVEFVEAHLYAALSRAACCDAASPNERERHLEALRAHHEQLAERARHCQENYGNRELLVSAEIARIEGRTTDAEVLYEAAIRSARDSAFIHNEALCHEQAARFYLARGFDDIGLHYMRRARAGYLRWGADAKVRQLDDTFPALAAGAVQPLPPTGTIAAPVEGLDLGTVIKVSQALSSEIVLERMPDTLLRIAIEHAGAARGVLALVRATEHRIVAEATVDRGAVEVRMLDQPLDEGAMPLTVLHYVLRTHQSLILDDAAARGEFSSDPYVRAQRARSVLCLPLLKQSTLVGLLYLENPLAARAFTPARTAVLDLIASQAAIALENARLYADLQKAQRVEAMGTLAGGIAHDFNNILGAILGYGEMALRGVRQGTQLRRDLGAIMAAGERGRALVDRVLAFSRSGVAERIPVHVEKVVAEALDLLAAQLPPAVRLDSELACGHAAVQGDPTQVHQVVMNLVTNAAHAMPDGGVLRVRLSPQRSNGLRAATIGRVDKGDYLVLSVADTGLGMAPHMLDRIFEPFFTTKGAGIGTGLGLSLVHDIVTQLDGAIDVASTPGQGSTFRIHLPRMGDALPDDADAGPVPPRGHGQRVLVVDDEEALVKLAARMLDELGYVPVCFTSSIQALAAMRAEPARFDALVADERMPGMSGSELAREVRRLRTGLPILLMSGFIGGGLPERAQAAGANELLKKPLTVQDLAGSLARALQA